MTVGGPIQRVLAWASLGFCFLVFPGILLVTATDHLLKVVAERQRLATLGRLEARLNRLDPYKRDVFFFHDRLRRAWEDAVTSPDPVRRMAVWRRRLQRAFPGGLQFVVWDGRGRLQEALTDIRGWRYVLTRVWTSLRALTIAGRQDPAIDPLGLPEVAEQIKLLRSVLGGFLVPWHLRLPFLPDPLGSVILADFRPDRSHCWFRVDDRLGVLVFLRWDLLHRQCGLRWQTRRLNARLPAGEGTGFAFPEGQERAGASHRPRQIFTRPGMAWQSEIELALAAFDNTAEPFQETAHLLLAIRPLEAGRHAFAWVLRERALPDPRLVRQRVHLGLALLALPWLWGAWSSWRGRPLPYLSLRWQLVGVFLYANGLPLLVLGFIGHDYLQNQRATWREQVRLQGTRLLRACDARFPTIAEELTERLRVGLHRLDLRKMPNALSDAMRARLARCLAACSPTEFYVVSSQSRIVMSHLTEGRAGPRYPTTHLRVIGRDFLRFFNGELIDIEQGNRAYSAQGIPTHLESVLNSALEYLGRVHRMRFGDAPKWCFWEVLGPLERGQADHILFVFWSEARMQELFLRQILPRLSPSATAFRVAARLSDGRLVRSARCPWPRQARRVFPASGELPTDLLELPDASGTVWLGTGFRGQAMPEVTLGAFLPRHVVEERVDALRRRLLLFGLGSLVLTLVIGQLLARQFLGPLGWFAAAARHIAARQFRFRLPAFDRDELGHLGDSLNRTLVSLEELDLGKVVQGSLLPGERFCHGGFICCGRSEPVTDLGGDLFDFFTAGENGCGVLVGDVAGHGVPAALMMAFAKAGVALAEASRTDPQMLLRSLHRLFRANQEAHRRPAVARRAASHGQPSLMHRPMTMLCAVGDGHTGQVTLANAGHCYPLLVRATDRAATYLEIAGAPIGAVRTPRVGTLRLALAPGDRLILYTDGFIEARNAQGEIFGFPRFREAVAAAHEADPERMVAAIWNALRGWAPTAEDDLTLVIMQRAPCPGTTA
ncbi:MAG: Serine phosphatase RsbU, regulator of sigma subunit [Candidatus Ozemobacter sibiricus]|uniref:Serine phosphatase RsbU, regulator of sigma subunit n=1 Tax=Candidatus Ozemobacter sibiricus TaxID=2268124 RepID=A0A367ZL85_9BACT|nr:MAG: Serine phosphatase RsbU, regulator of sigma subunit [Candidatus Ozemobacter sibiricus]